LVLMPDALRRAVLAILLIAIMAAVAVVGTSCAQPSVSIGTSQEGSLGAPEVMELTASGGPLPAGRYTRREFVPRITFEVDGPWVAEQLHDGFFDVQQDVGSPDVIAVQFARPDAIYGAEGAGVTPATAAEAVEILGENPGLEVVETSASRMGGLEGSQVTVENTTGADAQVLHVPPGSLAIATDRRLWIAFFDTPDGLLAIMVGGSVARWEEALAVAEPVLESVTIGP
jgi:hypothetical protein